MTFLPIVARELRVASRRKGTYWNRLAVAGISIVIGSWILFVMHQLPNPFVGKALFGTLAVLAFVYCLGAGVRTTSDCLSEEKREGTLGLLFLTDLKSYDVVLGKLVASSLNSAYALLAFFPVLAISLLLGGVTYAEFWRVMLVSINLLFLSLSAGVFASAICISERKAMSASLLILLFLCFAPPLLGLSLMKTSSAPYNMAFWIPSPAYNFELTFDPAFQARRTHFWWSLGITHFYGWLFLLLACWRVPHSWQDRPVGTNGSQWKSLGQVIIRGRPATRTVNRARLLEVNPFFWLATRDRGTHLLAWIFLFGVAAVWIWMWREFPRDWQDKSTYVLTALTVHVVLKFWVASEACRRFIEDRRSGALELMLCTPLTIAEILRGQRLALRHQFAGPVLTVVLVDIVFILAGIDRSIADERMWILVGAVGVAMLILDVWTLSWVGMWLGLTKLDSVRAASVAVARILLWPWIIWGLAMSFIEYSVWLRRMNLDEKFFPLLWFAIGAVNNFVFVWAARRNLQRRFREMAAKRFVRKRRWWKLRAKGNDSPAAVS